MDLTELSAGNKLVIRDEIRNGDFVTLRPMEPGTVGMFRVTESEVGTVCGRSDYLLKKADGDVRATPIGCRPLMGLSDLKPHIDVTQDTVECFVRGCPLRVRRQGRELHLLPEFTCPVHRIAVTSSTFEYPSEAHNILDRSDNELAVLSTVQGAKRESRMARERSEDAVTWNVFRALQNGGMLSPWLSEVSSRPAPVEDVVYWSYSTAKKEQWQPLNCARKAFGERISRASEPDMIVLTDKMLFFIEAKLDASNDTSGTGKTLEKRLSYTHYTDGAWAEWFSSVFAEDYKTIVEAQRYELMRFWLLGTWLAAQMKRDFCLLLLMRQQAQPKIHQDFSRRIKEEDARRFVRKNWEDIYHFVEKQPGQHANFSGYLKGKTLGYDSNGDIRRAFSI